MEKLRTRRTLERYVSKNLVKEVLDNPDSYYSTLRGVRVPVTILFSDLIGFTTLAEKADPEALVGCFIVMQHVVALKVFEIATSHRKMVGGIMDQVVGQVSDRESAHDRSDPLRRPQELAENERIKQQKKGRHPHPDIAHP